MPEFALEMRQISKTYGRVRANDAINLKVRKGTIHAIAGENGAGKSTLMKILFGLEKPDPQEGSGIFINGEHRVFKSPIEAIKNDIGMVQQHFALAQPLTALDNIILGEEPSQWGLLVDRDEALKILREVAPKSLEVPSQKTIENLPIGLQQRVEILKLLFRHAEILILDEPTAVLTPQEVDVFFELLRDMRKTGKTIIIITHKLHEIFSISDDVTVLRQGSVTGVFETRKLSQEQLVTAMIGRKLAIVHKEEFQGDEEIIECRGVCSGKLKNINLNIKKGEILGVAGVEGHGQQELVEVLLGLKKYSGEISYEGKPLPAKTEKIRNHLNFGLISEDRHKQSILLGESISYNSAIGIAHRFEKFGILNNSKIELEASRALKGYEVKMSSLKQKMSELSGGNQQKTVVARELGARNPDFLIACQPTRGVDVGAIEFIHKQFIDFQKKNKSILLISSELEELMTLSDRIIVFFDGQIAAVFSRSQFDTHKIGAAMLGLRP